MPMSLFLLNCKTKAIIDAQAEAENKRELAKGS
jgi:hypothetical protein